MNMLNYQSLYKEFAPIHTWQSRLTPNLTQGETLSSALVKNMYEIVNFTEKQLFCVQAQSRLHVSVQCDTGLRKFLTQI